MEFAHTYKSSKEAFKKFAIREAADFTIILRRADGIIKTVDSIELPAYADEFLVVSAAMSAVTDYDDSCDLYHFGEYYGTAEYVDMTPDSWFSRMQVVFSTPYC